jgi:UrcA family protein
MRTSTTSTPLIEPRRGCLVAVAVAALSLVSARAHADDPERVDVITVLAPAARIVRHDAATSAPIQEMSVTARVQFDPVTLTTNSEVALLKDSVVEAAQKACGASLTEDAVDCTRDAINSAQPEVDAAIAQARRSATE